MRKRRRIANILDEMPSYRKSHLRLFISHKEKEIVSSGAAVETKEEGGEAAAAAVTTDPAVDTTKKGTTYEIIVEGKLLIGHLDHKRAKEIDDALYGGQVNPDVDPSDRSQYRGGISERESDTPVEPINFTHLLDQFQAVIYTVWQPNVPEIKTPSKRQKGKRQAPASNIEDSLQASPKTTLVWRREAGNSTIGTSKDAHAFVLPYTCPAEPPSSHLKFHSVVVEIQMWMRSGEERVYQPCPALVKAMFPQHANERHVPGANSGGKKRGKKQQRIAVEDQIPVEAKDVIPVANSIFVPSLLTMKELISAFFHYIRFKNLQDEVEKSIVVCDKTLQALLECERFNFADLHFLLNSKNLITDATLEASSFTYVVSNAQDAQHVLSLDMDVHVPSLFHYRCRELLRRIKQREFEYTSSRTKARNWLVTGRAAEDKVRQLLEDCVTGQGYTMQHIGSWLALARAAPEGSEARQTAQLDAQICYLLERAEHHAKSAQAAWSVVETCGGGLQSAAVAEASNSTASSEKDEL